MALATLLLALAATVFFFSHNQLVHAYGCIACITAVGLARMAKGQPRLNLLKRPAEAPPNRSMWAIGFAFIPLLAASYFSMRVDSSHGGHAAWPAYLFTGVVIIGGSFWAYLVASNI